MCPIVHHVHIIQPLESVIVHSESDKKARRRTDNSLRLSTRTDEISPSN